MDSQSEQFLSKMGELDHSRSQKIPSVKTVLVILSSKGIVFDEESLSQKVRFAYPEAEVYFESTIGKSLGGKAPAKVDLLIDFTGPGERQGIFAAKGFRRRARVSVGRNAGFFRKSLYDRVFDDKNTLRHMDVLERERAAQRQVLELAGVPFVQMGETPRDLSRSIALGLPPMKKLSS